MVEGQNIDHENLPESTVQPTNEEQRENEFAQNIENEQNQPVSNENNDVLNENPEINNHEENSNANPVWVTENDQNQNE